MPYAVNTNKGTILNNADIGELPGGVAIPITQQQVNIAKHLLNVVVFDRVAGRDFNKDFKGLYGIDISKTQPKPQLRTYQDFVRVYKDVKVASQKWDEYRKQKGIKG